MADVTRSTVQQVRFWIEDDSPEPRLEFKPEEKLDDGLFAKP